MWIIFLFLFYYYYYFFYYFFFFYRIFVVEKRGGPDPLDPPSGSAPASNSLLLYLATWLRHNMKATLFIALKAGSHLPQARPKCVCCQWGCECDCDSRVSDVKGIQKSFCFCFCQLLHPSMCEAYCRCLYALRGI